MKKTDMEALIDEALDNIRTDRKVARELLNDIVNVLAGDPDENKYLSQRFRTYCCKVCRNAAALQRTIGKINFHSPEGSKR